MAGVFRSGVLRGVRRVAPKKGRRRTCRLVFVHAVLRRFRLTHPLPRYLILHYKRFKLNNFFVEKNPTLVTFPVKNLELKDYVDGTPPPSGKQTIGTKFNLVANVCHTGTPEAGKYVCHVLHRATDEWYTVDVSAPPTPHPALQARNIRLQRR